MLKKINWFYVAVGFLLALLLGYFLVAKGFIPAPKYLQVFFVITFSALVDSLNPCAFSVLFLTVAFLFSLGRERKFILKTGLMYILGIAFTYVAIGLGVLKVLSFFDVPNGMAKFGAFAIIIFGLIGLINEFFPSFPIKLKIPNSAHLIIAKYMEKASFISAFLMGILVGLFEFPCTGGPYLLVLGMLHDHGTFWFGFLYLIFYNVVFVFPLLVALLFSVDRKVAEKIDILRRQETKKARLTVALIMIVLGLLILLV